MRAFVVLYSLFLSVLLGLIFLVFMAFSFSGYPRNVWLLLLWCLAAYGIAGLICSFVISPKTSFMLQAQALMLVCGMAAAMGFIFLASLASPVSLAVLMYSAVLLPAFFLAIQGIRLARRRWRQLGTAEATPWKRLILLLALPPLLLCGGRIAVQELVMWWYGHDLPARAEAAAMRVSQGSTFCLLSSFGDTTFADLDARSLLIKALDNNYGLNQYKRPHFWIRVADQDYWWSFRANDFVAWPRHIPRERLGLSCTEMMSIP